MTPILFAVLSLAGGLGAALRLFLDGAIKQHTKMSYPLGTTIINVTGAFLLGTLTGAAVDGGLPTAWSATIGTGLLGGYTTFSTASFETVRLIQERRFLAGTLNSIGMLSTATVAAAIGLWGGTLL